MRTFLTTPVLVTPPAAEPVTVEELKLHCRKDTGEEDTLLQTYLYAAREWFEASTDRAFVTQTWRVTLPDLAWSYYELPRPPLQSVTSVTYRDTAGVTQTVAASTYDVVTSSTPGRIQLDYGSSWPATDEHPEAVAITYVAGYGAPSAVPRLVRQGILMLAGYWYEQREAVVQGLALQIKEVPLGVQHIVAAAGAYRF